MAWYNNELGHQLDNQNQRWVRSDLLDDDLSQRHTGLALGEYKEPSKDELLNNLRAQVKNKNERLEKYDKFEQVGAKGGEEAAENRNYLASRMTEEVTEMIRVLQVMNL